MAPFDPEDIDVLDFLDCLGIDNIEEATDTEIRFSCPFPGHSTGDSNPSAYMNAETTAFLCHGCHAKGNAVHFASEALGVSVFEATSLLRERYSPSGIDPFSRSAVDELKKYRERKKKIPKENVILDEKLVNQFLVDWDIVDRTPEDFILPEFKYILNRGFTIFTLNEWQFGFDERSRRIVFPVRDEDGNLVGFKARATDKRKNKYLNLGGKDYGWNPFFKNNVVFGMDKAKEYEDLIVTEGELNVIMMHQAGWTSTVGINGSYFGDRQVKLLKQFADTITIFFDSDPAGFDATRALGESLLPFISVRVCPNHDGDACDMGQDEIDDCIRAAIPYNIFSTTLNRSM